MKKYFLIIIFLPLISCGYIKTERKITTLKDTIPQISNFDNKIFLSSQITKKEIIEQHKDDVLLSTKKDNGLEYITYNQKTKINVGTELILLLPLPLNLFKSDNIYKVTYILKDDKLMDAEYEYAKNHYLLFFNSWDKNILIPFDFIKTCKINNKLMYYNKGKDLFTVGNLSYKMSPLFFNNSSYFESINYNLPYTCLENKLFGEKIISVLTPNTNQQKYLTINEFENINLVNKDNFIQSYIKELERETKDIHKNLKNINIEVKKYNGIDYTIIKSSYINKAYYISKYLIIFNIKNRFFTFNFNVSNWQDEMLKSGGLDFRKNKIKFFSDEYIKQINPKLLQEISDKYYLNSMYSIIESIIINE